MKSEDEIRKEMERMRAMMAECRAKYPRRNHFHRLALCGCPFYSARAMQLEWVLKDGDQK